MKGTKEQVKEFSNKCEEIKKCKFIMATTKIKDLLKCIVNNPELYALFDSVSKEFDYSSAKQEYLKTINNGIILKYGVTLPEEVGSRLAFIFCLLCEFDNGTINFNEFLQTYFAEDGSYFASYQEFCNRIISPLEELVKQVFEAREDSKIAEDKAIKIHQAESAGAELLSLLTAESERMFKSNITIKEKEAGLKILDELKGAIKDCNESLVDALICGYNYFVMFNGIVDKSLEDLIVKIFDFESLL